MDSVKHLLHFSFKFAVIIFSFVAVWWFVTLIAPQLSPRSLFSAVRESLSMGGSSSASSTLGDSWLPSPRNTLDTTPKVAQTTLFTGYGDQSGGGEFDYIEYQERGIQMAQGKTTRPRIANQQQTTTNNATQLTSLYSSKNLFVQRLSIYEKGHVYMGLSFTGEARESMFIGGKFPVVIVDPSTGQAVHVAFAEALTNWTIPGWVKFQVKITELLPTRRLCVMVFEQARMQNSKTQPIRVVFPITCN